MRSDNFLIKHLASRRFLVFLSVGLASAAVDLAIMQSLIWVGLMPWLAATAGFALSTIVNYTSHLRFTFNTVSSNTRIFRYLVVLGANYALTIICVQASVWLINAPLVGKILSFPLLAVNGFLFSKFWIFPSTAKDA